MGSLKDIWTERRLRIVADFIAGMNMEDITAKYGLKDKRTVYYHLNRAGVGDQERKTRLENIERIKNEVVSEENL